MINKHKSNKIKENSNTVRHLNNGTDHRHSKSCCDQSSPARRTTRKVYISNFEVEPKCLIDALQKLWVIYMCNTHVYNKSYYNSSILQSTYIIQMNKYWPICMIITKCCHMASLDHAYDELGFYCQRHERDITIAQTQEFHMGWIWWLQSLILISLLVFAKLFCVMLDCVFFNV